MGRDVVWRSADEVAVDLTGRPDQQLIAEMADILSAFADRDGRTVLPLRHPVAGVEVDPGVRGGYPVLEGTRVPYDVVASLVGDGLDPREIAGIYPSVDPAAVAGATEFARHVERQRGVAAA
ncbi:MAG TPA: DUF433 domain-containing protein [Mycobacteriales bacterium]|nr:DUF433 domain-containing protein [Mycobacteriales bacterium]